MALSLMIIGIKNLSCVCWPFVCLLQKNVYSGPLPILIKAFWFLGFFWGGLHELIKYFILFFKFIYLLGRWGEEQRDREREKTPSRLCTVSTEPNVGLELKNCEIMTRGEIKSQTLN